MQVLSARCPRRLIIARCAGTECGGTKNFLGVQVAMPFRHFHHAGGIILAAIAAIGILTVLLSGSDSKGARAVLTVLAVIGGAVIVSFILRGI